MAIGDGGGLQPVGLNAGIVYNSDPTSRIFNFLALGLELGVQRYLPHHTKHQMRTFVFELCPSKTYNQCNGTMHHLKGDCMWAEFPEEEMEEMLEVKPEKLLERREHHIMVRYGAIVSSFDETKPIEINVVVSSICLHCHLCVEQCTYSAHCTV